VKENHEGGQWIEKSRQIGVAEIFEPGIFLKTNITPVLNVMHARLCYEVAGEFDESLPVLEDLDYWIRLSRYWNFDYISKITAEVRTRDDRPDNLTQINSSLFEPALQYLQNKHRSRDDYHEAFLLFPGSVTDWKSFVVTFLLSAISTGFISLIISLNPKSSKSITEDDIKNHIFDIITRAGFIRFPPIWILSNQTELLDTISKFAAVYSISPGGGVPSNAFTAVYKNSCRP
jgi:hypothetical protein